MIAWSAVKKQSIWFIGPKLINLKAHGKRDSLDWLAADGFHRRRFFHWRGRCSALQNPRLKAKIGKGTAYFPFLRMRNLYLEIVR